MTDRPDLPEAVVVPHSRLRPELIWAIPIVAVLIGGWLAVRAIRARGPTITVTFRDAAGLVAGKTKIRYRDVDVGEVRDLGFSPDRATVVITAELLREAGPWMVDPPRGSSCTTTPRPSSTRRSPTRRCARRPRACTWWPAARPICCGRSCGRCRPRTGRRGFRSSGEIHTVLVRQRDQYGMIVPGAE